MACAMSRDSSVSPSSGHGIPSSLSLRAGEIAASTAAAAGRRWCRAVLLVALLTLTCDDASAGRTAISMSEPSSSTTSALLHDRSLGARALRLQREQLSVSLSGLAEIIRERRHHPDIWACRVSIRQSIARWKASPASALEWLGLPESTWRGHFLGDSRCPLGGDYELRVVRLGAAVVVVLRCLVHRDEQRLLLSPVESPSAPRGR